MIIPANVTDLKKKLQGAFNKKPGEKVLESDKTKDLSRRIGTDVAKERAKRKALTDELANEKTSSIRKQEIIDGLNAQLEAAQTENEEYKSKLEEIEPNAKKWKDFDHKERQKLIASFPTEEQKDAKAIAEGMDLETFRKYTSKVTGKGVADAGTAGSKGKEKDWETILKSETADKDIAADPAGFNKFMDERGK